MSRNVHRPLLASVLLSALACGQGPGANNPPQADAGPDQTIPSARWTGLYGGNSSDPDPQAKLSFYWTQSQGPPVQLFEWATPTPYFKGPVVGSATQLVFTLAVSDGAAVATDTTTVTVDPLPAEFVGGALELAPYRDQLTPREARHLLRRAGYSGSPSEVAHVVAQGLSATVAELMNPVAVPVLDREAWSHVPPHDRTVEGGDDYPQAFLEEVSDWWLTYKVESPLSNQLKERIAYFWHDRWATSGRVATSRERHWRMRHLDVFRRTPFPQYRELLIRLGRDALMLDWLDGFRNRVGSPNENYAREFWELFTLGVTDPFTGVPNYSEADIQQAARAFTGWDRIDGPQEGNSYEAVFDPSRHDFGIKNVFGQVGNWNDVDVVDITLARPQAAEYVCHQLFMFFAHEAPDHRLVQILAEILRATGWQTSAVVSTILRSEAMFSPEAHKNRIKTPVEFTVGFMRETGLRIPVDDVSDRLLDLGQELGNPPDVKGWQEGPFWLGEAAMTYRAQIVNDLVSGRQHQTGLDLTPLLPQQPDLRRAANTIAHVMDVLDVGLQSDAQFHTLVEYMNDAVPAHASSSETQDAGVPFDGNNPAHLDKKLRGLLFMLAVGNPEYHVN